MHSIRELMSALDPIQLSAALGALVGGVAFDARGSGAVFVVCAIFWALSSLIARMIFTRSARLPT